MRKWLTTIAAAALMASIATAAHAQEGWYARADVGYSVDGSVHVGSAKAALNKDWMGDVGAGYAFDSGLRLEGEIGYRHNQFDHTNVDVNATSLMINALYDFNHEGRWRPYVGLGAGYAKIDAQVDDDTSWAWQAMAGVGYALGEHTTLDVGYRYFDAPSLHLAGDNSAEYKHQAVTVGIRYLFSAPPPPPPPPPPPAPVPPPPPPPPPACPQSDFTVYFEWDRSNLNAAAAQVIDEAAHRAMACNITIANVVGHTDTSGSAQYNMGLSQRRADVVRDALVQRGIAASTITTQARGEGDLAKPTRNGVREPLNRRTAVTITFH